MTTGPGRARVRRLVQLDEHEAAVVAPTTPSRRGRAAASCPGPGTRERPAARGGRERRGGERGRRERGRTPRHETPKLGEPLSHDRLGAGPRRTVAAHPRGPPSQRAYQPRSRGDPCEASLAVSSVVDRVPTEVHARRRAGAFPGGARRARRAAALATSTGSGGSHHPDAHHLAPRAGAGPVGEADPDARQGEPRQAFEDGPPRGSRRRPDERLAAVDGEIPLERPGGPPARAPPCGRGAPCWRCR